MDTVPWNTRRYSKVFGIADQVYEARFKKKNYLTGEALRRKGLVTRTIGKTNSVETPSRKSETITFVILSFFPCKEKVTFGPESQDSILNERQLQIHPAQSEDRHSAKPGESRAPRSAIELVSLPQHSSLPAPNYRGCHVKVAALFHQC